ncbi:hypothetical protein AAFF_G00144400 [Aldrovandia affinis]|uniref:LIM zinc-binding domain-containing protein n=1 Tax=Aldrovandia affinis TaxID=143900 RepID=A0AAD7T1A0_9TELE|nr:hypothetical protein AAFF_G00144400 [Aldrovandia affinis]
MLKFWFLTGLLGLVGPHVASIVVLEFCLRAVAARITVGPDMGSRYVQQYLVQCQFSLGCALSCSLHFLQEGALRRSFSLLLAVGPSWLLASQSERLWYHVAALYPLHSSQRYCGVCITLLASGHALLPHLCHAVLLAFAVAAVAAICIVNHHFLLVAEALQFWTPLTIFYTLLVVYIQEEQHRRPGGEALFHTAVVRLGGLLVLMVTVGTLVDVAHILLCFLGEAACLMPTRDLLDCMPEEECDEHLGKPPQRWRRDYRGRETGEGKKRRKKTQITSRRSLPSVTMASATPQKRMVSSVFITLASPHRATVTPSARATNTHSAALTDTHTATRVSLKDSGRGVLSQSHTHNAPTTESPTASYTPTPSSSIPPSPTHTLLPLDTRAAPSPSASSPCNTATWKEDTSVGDCSTEDFLPPPPSPPPPDAELCSDLTSPLPPPPLLEPLAERSLSVSQGEPPQSASQRSTALEPDERTPPGGRNQNKPLQTIQPSQEEETELESRDVCGFCRKQVALSDPAIEALNRTYHANCFQCRQCHAALAGKMYYNKAGIPLCEDCYLASLEQCWACGEVIKDHVIRALGRAYHPACFICTTCSRPIGEERFAQGEVGEVYCLPDYYRKYAPQCNVCQQMIVPGKDGRDSFTVECLGRSFHEDCYRCEVCRVLLSTEPNEQGCYPLDGQILCKPCHLTLVQEGHH